MATYSTINCECCDPPVVECPCCDEGFVAVNTVFHHPTYTPNPGFEACAICSELSEQDSLTPGGCLEWQDQYNGDCGFINWEYGLTCTGSEIIAFVNIRADDGGGGAYQKSWTKTISATPTIACSGLNVTFDAGDVIAEIPGGQCDVGDTCGFTL